MKFFLSSLLRNLIACFKGRLLIWHALAILVTVTLVLSGFDWRYFQAANQPMLRAWMFPAAPIGFFLPILLPLFLFAAAAVLRNTRFWLAGFAVAQAEIIALIISSVYKAFTGRAHPMRNGAEDLTRTFHFGFLRGGMFWGWPSSHTTVAFAMAFAVITLFPKSRSVGFLALAYALYIGLGISATIHWFSDFTAGVIIGAVIGIVVGRRFRQFPAPLPQ